jgi:excisionase family DNA binding protein
MAIRLPVPKLSRQQGSTLHSVPTLPQHLMTLREARTFVSVSDATIRRWIRRGDLPYYRVGRQIRIDSADLMRFLASSS